MGQSSVANTCLTIPLYFAHDPLATDWYFDIAQCLSIMNRRSYRQGMNYAVQSVEVFAPSSGNVKIYTVPTTWVADNAITKAFETWKDQRADVLKESPSLKAKWSDFKVYLDSGHVSSGVAGNLTPEYAAGPFGVGEWNVSELAIPLDGGSGGSGATPEVTMHVVGDNVPAGAFAAATTTSASLIEAYAQSRGIILAPDPDQPGGSNLSLYNELASHDELSEQVLNNVANANDEPPYDKDDYPGGANNGPVPQFVDIIQCQNYGDIGSGVLSTDSIGSFIAPMGLIKLEAEGFEADDSITIIVRLAPGNYKGVLAERGV